MLQRLIEIARPGALYPDARRLTAHVGFLCPAGSEGINRELRIDPGSGLPTVVQWLSVRAEREVARGRDAAGLEGPRARYAHALLASELLEASSVAARFRKRDGQHSLLEVRHDRIDAASGCPLRYTVEMTQRGRRPVALGDDDVPEPSRRFVHLMERHSGADAELALLLLSELPGARVEEVVRGQVGPLHFDGVAVPPLLAPLFEEVKGAFVLHLAFERAGTAVAADSGRDPLAPLYRDSLSPEARAPIEEMRARLGYRVAKERRLVCTPSAEEPLKALLARAGLSLVVRSV